MARRLSEEEVEDGEKGSPSDGEPLSWNANEPPRTLQTMPAGPRRPEPSHLQAAILLTHCFMHSFSHTKYLMLTAVNFKQPCWVCFSNFVCSDGLSILGGWGSQVPSRPSVRAFMLFQSRNNSGC